VRDDDEDDNDTLHTGQERYYQLIISHEPEFGQCIAWAHVSSCCNRLGLVDILLYPSQSLHVTCVPSLGLYFLRACLDRKILEFILLYGDDSFSFLNCDPSSRQNIP
jgi:hypothetical protein